MRAAGAEVRCACCPIGEVADAALHPLQPVEARRELNGRVAPHHAAADRDGDRVDVERPMRRKQGRALLVHLADAGRPVGKVVELLAQLRLDQRALLLDDHDRLEAFGEGAHALRLQRPRAGELEQADAESVGLDFVDAERLQRLAHVGIGFAGRDDAEPRPRPAG